MPSRTPSGPYCWVRSPFPKLRISDAVKAEATQRAQALVDTVLKPKFVREPPDNPRWNYIVDVGIRWYHSFLYFFATYCCPGPDTLSPSFEARFARMEFAGENCFHLASMRYTGEWIALYRALPITECLDAIRDDPWFQM